MSRFIRLLNCCVLISLLVSGCSRELSNEGGMGPIATAATGTLQDSSGNCMTITPHGSYFNGVPILGDSNFVEVTVDVKTPGSYRLLSDRQNGIQFAGSGAFQNTGIQTVKLKASGTPAQIQTTNFSVSFDGSSCGFSISVQDSTGHSGTSGSSSNALNSWQFTANGHIYAGNITAAQFTNLIGATLVIGGNMASGSTDTLFGLSIQFPGSTLDTGTYSTTAPGTSFVLQKISTASSIFSANASSAPPVLNIAVSAYDPSTKIVTGSFSGQAFAFDSLSNPVTVNITNGMFKGVVR